MLFRIFDIETSAAKGFIAISHLMSFVDSPLARPIYPDLSCREYKEQKFAVIEWEDVGQEDIETEFRFMCAEMCFRDDTYFTSNSRSVGNAILESGHGWFGFDDFEVMISEKLDGAIKRLPFRNIMNEKGGGHREAYREVLREIIGKFNLDGNIKTQRSLVLWLLIVAIELGGGNISENKSAFIGDLKDCFDIEDDVFEDLQERAVSLYKELLKTTSIIFE